jgi:hypothetical protein
MGKTLLDNVTKVFEGSNEKGCASSCPLPKPEANSLAILCSHTNTYWFAVDLIYVWFEKVW